MVGSHLPDVSHVLPSFFGNGKGLIQRVTEIALGTRTSFVVHKYILKTSF